MQMFTFNTLQSDNLLGILIKKLQEVIDKINNEWEFIASNIHFMLKKTIPILIKLISSFPRRKSIF